jgi:predicted PurR-regulated permease PerM
MVEPRWTDATKRMVVVVGVLIIMLLFYLGRSVLPTLLLAMVLAYILTPIVSWLNRRLRFPYTLATVSVYLLLLALIVAIPVLIGPTVIRQIGGLQLDLVELFNQAREWVRDILESARSVSIGDNVLDLSTLVDPALDALGPPGSTPALPAPQTWLPSLFGTVTGLATTIASALAAFFLTLLYSFYLVKDSPAWVSRLNQWIAEPYWAEFRELRRRLSDVWRSFFRGLLMMSLIIGTMTYLALLGLGIPWRIPLALTAALLEVIPNLGPLLALIPAVLVTLIQGSTTIPLSNGWMALVVFAAYILIQQIENNFLVPRIIGESVDLPPLMVLVGVVIGASAFGLVGAFMASPLLASLRILILYAHAKIMDRPPFPEPVEEKESTQTGPPSQEGEAAAESGDPPTPVASRELDAPTEAEEPPLPADGEEPGAPAEEAGSGAEDLAPEVDAGGDDPAA